jgi:Tfp pilus assembly protein PilF
VLIAGTLLGPYRIVAALGAGGMGEVYRARDARLGRDVAIKVITAELSGSPDHVKRFEQEARAAGALSHPNVCAILDVGMHERSSFVVMELLEGESLRDRLNAGPVPVRKALDWTAQAARGLAAAHEKGIVHRDLKPENLFLTKDGQTKVLDFGLAKLTRPELLAPSGEKPVPETLTETGAIMGTVGYMAPEHVRGEAADHRADLFALGAILYELLTGERAFAGVGTVETLYLICHVDPVPLSISGREIPPGLEAIVRRCLEKEPAQRFQSASDLAFDLNACLKSLDHAAGSRFEAKPPGHAPATARPRPRWRRAIAPAAVVLLAILGALWRLDALQLKWPRATPAIRTLVVAQEYQPAISADVKSLGEGVVQRLTDGLCQLPRISVLSNEGVPALVEQPLDVARIRNELGADALVTVGVTKTDYGYEVRVALTDTRSLRHLWGGVYKRRSRDVADTVEGVSHDVTEALQLRLSVEDQRHLEAYRIFQKARYYWDTRSADGLAKAIDNYNKVIRIDPSFAPAYAGLANCYSLLCYYGGASPAESFPKAKAMARKALELDETLAEAHTALAVVLRDYDYSWAASEREFKRAIELNPGYATAYQWYAEYLAALGRFDEAVQVMRKALELAPLEPIIAADLAWVFYLARRPDDAIAQLIQTIEREPEFAPAHWFLSLAYAQKGLLVPALVSIDTAVALSGGSTRIMADCAVLHARAGNRYLAESLSQRFHDAAARGSYVSPYESALVNIALGRNGQALDLLEQAVHDRRWELVNLQVDPMLDPLRQDGRFARLVRRLGFP